MCQLWLGDIGLISVDIHAENIGDVTEVKNKCQDRPEVNINTD